MTIPDVIEQPRSRRGLLAAVAAVGAAFLASLCCIGPLLFVTLGVGAGLASTFAPLQPFFTVVAAVLLALGFYVVYGRRRAKVCAPEASCTLPRDRTRDKALIWLAAVVALAFLTFERWSMLLL